MAPNVMPAAGSLKMKFGTAPGMGCHLAGCLGWSAWHGAVHAEEKFAWLASFAPSEECQAGGSMVGSAPVHPG